MIIKGSQRGGAKQLAKHLSNILDNDHVELHELRGFVADTLEGALLESYAISKGTNADQHLFSVSFNPPPGKDVSVSNFENAFARVESRYGLENHARAIVFHEKDGRRHAHVVWSRIDCETMTAANLPFFKRELREISRELFIEHRWKMPKGLMNSEARVSHEFTLAEWHQMKRVKLKPDQLKSMFAECWAVSDSKAGFEAALRERGFFLAKGDQRSFVAMDLTGKVYSLSRFTGIGRPELEEWLGEPSEFLGIEERRTELKKRLETLAGENLQEVEQKHAESEKNLDVKLAQMRKKHRLEREELKKRHEAELLTERRERQQKLSKGLRGIWERLSGERTKFIEENKRADYETQRRILIERQALVKRQLEERGRLQVFLNQARKRLSESVTAAMALSARDTKHDSPIVQRIRKKPELILDMLSERESTFTRSMIQRELSVYLPGRDETRQAMAQIMSSPNLVELQSEEARSPQSPRYSTHDIIRLERGMLQDSVEMAGTGNFGVSKQSLKKAILNGNENLKEEAGVLLSSEQEKAVRHVTDKDQLACVIGVAGAGKSTMLSVAREAWEAEGRTVYGAALAGKAAKGLEEASGIKSRTLASYEYAWERDRDRLQKGDILVVDEAGMIGSKQMARFVHETNKAGAKVVLVGDADQLQPINAGAPFRAISEKVGYSTLHSVHRQSEEWQRNASQSFANRQTAEALEMYRKHGAIEFLSTEKEAINRLATDYVTHSLKDHDGCTQLALAHRRADVKALNDAIRNLRKDMGELGESAVFDTTHGKREFAVGDRLLFTKNDRDLNVKNGTLGTVIEMSQHGISVSCDGADTVTFDVRDYDHFNHGYATTIHKSQGATVDRSYVLASPSMDHHLSYVAMTRHKHETRLYSDKETFKSIETMTQSLARVREKRSTLDFKVETSICKFNQESNSHEWRH